MLNFSFSITRLSAAMVFILIPLLSLGQLKGRVVDADNAEPIIGATISFDNDGVVTDSLGYFTIENAPSEITVRYLGYETKTLEVNNNTYLTILLFPSVSNLNEVIITSYLSENRLLETPGPVALVSKKALDRDQGVIVTNTLNRVPGIYMHSGALNTNRITIRGIGSRSLFSTNRVRAYLNNIPLSTGEGETTVEDIDLSVIDRIEVLKGPASSIYGAGLGGVINLKTKSSIESPFISTDFQVGSYGLIRSVNQLGWGTANNANTITYTNTHSDGYRENNEYDRQSLLFTSNVHLANKSTLSFLGQWTDLKSFIPSSINFDTFQNSPRSAAPNWLAAQGFEDYTTITLGTTLTTTIKPWIDNTLSIFGSFRNSNEVRPFNTLKENTNAFGFRNLIDIRPSVFSLKPEFTLGVELLRDDYDFSTQTPDSLQALINVNNELRTNLNVFLNSHWPISDRLIVIAGINFNSTQYDLEDLVLTDGNDQSGSYEFDNVLSPRIAINYLIKPSMSIHASVSHGFSPPTLQETLQPDGIINNDIQPETGINYEVGSRGDLFNRRLSYDISAYSTEIENLLVARRVTEDQFVGINAGKSRHQGVEVSLSYDLLNNPDGHNSLISTLSFTAVDHEFVDFVDGDDNFSGNELPGNPSSIVNGIIDFRTQWGLFGNINAQGVGEQWLRDDNILSEEGYFLANVKLGYSKDFGPLKLTLYTGINNLFDESYASQVLINAGSFGGNAPRYYYPGLPRNYFGGVSLKWSFVGS